MSKKTILAAIREALAEEMARDKDVFVIGEDVGKWGGCFTVTKGLYDQFPDRMIDTPISENLIATMPIGMAMMGKRPVAEIMFADFAGLWYDGIANEAAKMFFVSNGKDPCPIVYRAAQGSGGGNACQHSQVIEGWLMNIPGIKIVSPSNPADAKGLLKAAIRDNNPVVFLEHKAQYGNKGEVPDEEYIIPIGKASVLKEGTDVTVIANQKMLEFAEEAVKKAEADGISVELIDPRTIKPYDAEAFCASAKKTGRVIIVHEGPMTGGYAAEFAFTIQQECHNELKKPVMRICGLDTCIPGGASDMFVLPDVDEIYNGIKELMK